MVSIFSIAPRAWLKLANTDAASTSPSKRLDGSQTCLKRENPRPLVKKFKGGLAQLGSVRLARENFHLAGV
jgi:hypothetical protein